jgi:hypothetical protein
MVLQGAVLPGTGPNAPSRLASRVTSVVPDQAAHRAGLKKGDVLLAADAHALVDALPTDVFDLLHASGTHVVITVAAIKPLIRDERGPLHASAEQALPPSVTRPREPKVPTEPTLAALELVNGERQRLATELRDVKRELTEAHRAQRGAGNALNAEKATASALQADSPRNAPAVADRGAQTETLNAVGQNASTPTDTADADVQQLDQSGLVALRRELALLQRDLAAKNVELAAVSQAMNSKSTEVLALRAQIHEAEGRATMARNDANERIAALQARLAEMDAVSQLSASTSRVGLEAANVDLRAQVQQLEARLAAVMEEKETMLVAQKHGLQAELLSKDREKHLALEDLRRAAQAELQSRCQAIAREHSAQIDQLQEQLQVKHQEAEAAMQAQLSFLQHELDESRAQMGTELEIFHTRARQQAGDKVSGPIQGALSPPDSCSTTLSHQPPLPSAGQGERDEAHTAETAQLRRRVEEAEANCQQLQRRCRQADAQASDIRLRAEVELASLQTQLAAARHETDKRRNELELTQLHLEHETRESSQLRDLLHRLNVRQPSLAKENTRTVVQPPRGNGVGSGTRREAPAEARSLQHVPPVPSQMLPLSANAEALHRQAAARLRQTHALELSILQREHEETRDALLATLSRQREEEAERLQLSHSSALQSLGDKYAAELENVRQVHSERLHAARRTAEREEAEAAETLQARQEQARQEARAMVASEEQQGWQRLQQVREETQERLRLEKQQLDKELEQGRALRRERLQQVEEDGHSELLGRKAELEDRHTEEQLSLERRHRQDLDATRKRQAVFLQAAEEEVARLQRQHSVDMDQLREVLAQELEREKRRGDATVGEARDACHQAIQDLQRRHNTQEAQVRETHQAYMAEAERDAKAALDRHRRQLTEAKLALERENDARLQELNAGYQLTLERQRGSFAAEVLSAERAAGLNAAPDKEAGAAWPTTREENGQMDVVTRLAAMRLKARLRMCVGLVKLQTSEVGSKAAGGEQPEDGESEDCDAETAGQRPLLQGLEEHGEILLQLLRKYFARERLAQKPVTEEATALVAETHASLTAALADAGVSAGLGLPALGAAGRDASGARQKAPRAADPLLLLARQTLELARRVPHALSQTREHASRQLEDAHLEARSLQARLGTQTAALDELSQQVQAALHAATSEESRAAGAISAARRATELMQQVQRAAQQETHAARQKVEELQRASAAQEREMATALSHASQGSRTAAAEVDRLRRTLADVEQRLAATEDVAHAAHEAAHAAERCSESKEADAEALRADVLAARAAQADEARRAAAAHAAEASLLAEVGRLKDTLVATRASLADAERSARQSAELSAQLDDERVALAAALGVNLTAAILSEEQQAKDGGFLRIEPILRSKRTSSTVGQLAAALALAQRELRARDERVAQLRACLEDARENMQRAFHGNGFLLAQLQHVAARKRGPPRAGLGGVAVGEHGRTVRLLPLAP